MQKLAVYRQASELNLGAAGCHRLAGWQGCLHVFAVEQGGLPLALLNRVVVRARRGSERFVMAPGSTARSLKKQFQSAAVPAWVRDGPLLFADDRLIWVAGLGADGRCLAEPGQAQCRIEWHRDGSTQGVSDCCNATR